MSLRHVNQNPRLSGDLPSALEPILREHGFAINQLIPKIATTANLPAANSELDGSYIIEDAGVNDVNLIIYAKGQRYRIDGGAPF